MKLTNLAGWVMIIAAPVISACAQPATVTNPGTQENASEVYYIKNITPENLQKVYHALNRKADGNKVGIKISTGESMKSHHLDTTLIAPFVREIGGTFVECNTAYNGNRNETEKHLRTAKEHGFTDLAGIDIMDAEGDVAIPTNCEGHLKGVNYVGKNMENYDFMVVLSHFKGHAMGGYGGALKNISIGIGSSDGKTWIHTAGATRDHNVIWKHTAKQDDFLESMAEAAKSVADHYGDKILYINVANNLSVDCDCDGNPAAPEMGDLGIFASLDPVALDKACVDMVFGTDDKGNAALIERINSRHGTHTIEHAEKLGIGTTNYKLITLE